MARVNADTDDPLGVSQTTPTKQDLIRIDRNLGAFGHLNVAFELVKELVWPLAIDHGAIEVCQASVLVLRHASNRGVRLLVLEVCLTI